MINCSACLKYAVQEATRALVMVSAGRYSSTMLFSRNWQTANHDHCRSCCHTRMFLLLETYIYTSIQPAGLLAGHGAGAVRGLPGAGAGRPLLTGSRTEAAVGQTLSYFTPNIKYSNYLMVCSIACSDVATGGRLCWRYTADGRCKQAIKGSIAA